MELQAFKQQLRELAQLEETEDLMVSSYHSLERPVSETLRAFQARRRTVIKGVDEGRREVVEQALDAVEEYLQERLNPASRSVAVFSRQGKVPFFLALEFQAPLTDAVVVDDVPNIYGLVELKDVYHRYLVMVCQEDQVSVAEVNLGAVTWQMWSERPELRSRVGREWTRRHYQRHLKGRTDKFLKECIGVLEQRMYEGGYKHLVLSGTPKVLGMVRQALPKHLEEILIEQVGCQSGSHETDNVVESTLEIFIEQERVESRATVDRVLNELRRSGLAAVGSDAARRAFQLGQVDMLVIDRRIPGSEREELARLATAAGAEIETIERDERLWRLGGVAVLLRFHLPNAALVRA
ncbi:host attachment protein [bacterium]|nr:host attachment protein [bacterium]